MAQIYIKNSTKKEYEAVQFNGYNDDEIKKVAHAYKVRHNYSGKVLNTFHNGDIEVEVHYPVQIDNVYVYTLSKGDWIIRELGGERIYDVDKVEGETFTKDFTLKGSQTGTASAAANGKSKTETAKTAEAKTLEDTDAKAKKFYENTDGVSLFFPNTTYLSVEEADKLKKLGTLAREQKQIYNVNTYANEHETSYLLNYQNRLAFMIYRAVMDKCSKTVHVLQIYDLKHNMNRLYFGKSFDKPLKKFMLDAADEAVNGRFLLPMDTVVALNNFIEDASIIL